MGVTEYIFHCGPIRFFFSRRLSLATISVRRPKCAISTATIAKQEEEKLREKNLADLNTIRCKIVKVACRDNRLEMFTVSLSSCDHDRKKSLLSLSLRTALAFVFFFFFYSFRTYSKHIIERPRKKRNVNRSLTCR